ncbi:MAG TPA: hypothetical protein VIP28_11800, partial [Nocardioides sp.]
FMVSAALALIVVVMAVLLPARAEGYGESDEESAESAEDSAGEPGADIDAELAELCEHGREPAVCGC